MLSGYKSPLRRTDSDLESVYRKAAQDEDARKQDRATLAGKREEGRLWKRQTTACPLNYVSNEGGSP